MEANTTVPVSVIEFDGSAYIGLEAFAAIDTNIHVDEAQVWLTEVVDLRLRGYVGDLVVDGNSYEFIAA